VITHDLSLKAFYLQSIHLSRAPGKSQEKKLTYF